MSNNKYMDVMESILSAPGEKTGVTNQVFALMALVKELQTLNETLEVLTMEVKGINLGLPID